RAEAIRDLPDLNFPAANHNVATAQSGVITRLRRLPSALRFEAIRARQIHHLTLPALALLFALHPHLQPRSSPFSCRLTGWGHRSICRSAIPYDAAAATALPTAKATPKISGSRGSFLITAAASKVA